jgi:membrane protein DedA with SNARE-associated domain
MMDDLSLVWELVQAGDVFGLIREFPYAFYVITFIWTFLEGETFVIFAGVAAHQGVLRLDLLIACAWIGSFCGDQTYFFIGRRYGKRVLKRFPKMAPSVDKALVWLGKSSTWFILTFRFIYGVRNGASFAMGMSPLPWSRFVWLNFIAAGIWATSFATAGWFLGQLLGDMLGFYAKFFLLGMLGIFVLVIIGVRVRSWIQKRKEKQLENA